MKAPAFIPILIALLLCGPALAHDITEGDMESFGRHAAHGETDAIDKISDAFTQLSSGTDYAKDMSRVYSTADLMKVAFGEIGSAVKKDGDESDPAFQSLLYATGKQNINGFAADALGTAAAAGNRPSLDVLLHYKEHGILLSSATIALVPAASKNIKEAVDF